MDIVIFITETNTPRIRENRSIGTPNGGTFIKVGIINKIQ